MRRRRDAIRSELMSLDRRQFAAVSDAASGEVAGETVQTNCTQAVEQAVAAADSR